MSLLSTAQNFIVVMFVAGKAIILLMMPGIKTRDALIVGPQ